MWLSEAITWIETELKSSGVSVQQYGYVALKIASDLINGGTKEAILADVLSLFGSAPAPANVGSGHAVGMSSDEQDAFDKLTALCAAPPYNGDQQAMFNNYASSSLIGVSGIESLLSDAGIGSWFTRPIIARGVISKLDTDGDGNVSWDEFQAGLKTLPPA